MKADEEPPMGTLLRTWREQALLTQDELAHRAQLNVRTIRRLEQGASHRPRINSLSALAKALNLDAAERTRLIAAASRIPARPEPRGPETAGDAPPRATIVRRRLPSGSTRSAGHESAARTRILVLAVLEVERVEADTRPSVELPDLAPQVDDVSAGTARPVGACGQRP
ncbi:helix-turn-helix transcriptional regulator [Nonomuraea sp. NPDC049695]|uniref:helix-turn-helix domain-containing protein n=1 Tax=Nonomuraea sp. NPDC049695 TaxID=3154734 RepID=UPI003443B91D